MIYDRVKELAKELYPQMLEFCQRIIRIPSESSYEGDVAKVYYDELIKLNYDHVLKDPWGNVVGIIKGTEPGPAIMYNGHMDVVTPGDLSLWEEDPYSAELKTCMMPDKTGSKQELTEALCGRGSADMKCGGAGQIYGGAILLRLRKEGYPIKGTYIVAQVGLEEYGEMLGTIKLLEYLDTKNIRIDAMVCGEPSNLSLALGHRGRMEIKITVFGKSCHGSAPWLGINAMNKAAKLIVEIEKRVQDNAREDSDLGRSGIALTMLNIEPCELCIVPDKCTIVYDRRLVEGESISDAIEEIETVIDELSSDDPEFKAKVEVNSSRRYAYTGENIVIESRKEAWKIEKDHPFIKACANGLKSIGSDVNYTYWPYSTDIPAVGVRMKKPVVGYSGMQDFSVHTCFEKTRTDYLAEALAGNVAIFLKTSELPLESFKC